jgi:flagellar basal body-associated protein FliL
VLCGGLKIAFFYPKMPAATKAPSKAPASSRRAVVFSMLLVVLLALGAWFWSSSRQWPEVPAGAVRPVKGSLHLETFVLNLADPEQRSYLRVGIDLGLDREIGKGENAPPIGEVRDTILGVLAQSRVDELLTAKGKAKLKEDVLHALQQQIPGLGVQEVYFTEFLIQR